MSTLSYRRFEPLTSSKPGELLRFLGMLISTPMGLPVQNIHTYRLTLSSGSPVGVRPPLSLLVPP